MVARAVAVDVAVVLVDVRLVVQNVQEVALFFVLLNAYKIAAEDAVTIVGRLVLIHALANVILCAHRIVMIAVQNNKDVIFIFYLVHTKSSEVFEPCVQLPPQLTLQQRAHVLAQPF